MVSIEKQLKTDFETKTRIIKKIERFLSLEKDYTDSFLIALKLDLHVLTNEPDIKFNLGIFI